MIPFFKQPWRIFVLLVFAAGVVGMIQQVSQLKSEYHSLTRSGEGPALDFYDPESEFSEGLQLLMKGEEFADDEEMRWEAVHWDKPFSGLHYARYLQKTGALPSDFREAVDQIDPGNAWFDLWEIQHHAENVFSEISSDEEQEDEDSSPAFEIHDEDEMERLIALFHQAASKNQLTDYFIEMNGLLADELSPPERWLEQWAYITYILEFATPMEVVRTLSDFVTVATQHFVETDDEQSFLKFEQSARKLIPLLYHNTIGALVFQSFLRDLYYDLAETTDHFQSRLDTDYWRLYNRIDHRLVKISENREHPVQEVNSEIIQKHGSMMANLTGLVGMFGEPVEIDKNELLPGCRAENAVITRIFSIILFAVFLFFGIMAWIFGLRDHPDQSGRIGERLSREGAIARWEMIFLAIIVPLALFLVVRHSTPLGRLDYSGHFSKFAHVSVPPVSLGLLLLACSVVMARRIENPDRSQNRFNVLLIALPVASILIVGAFPQFPGAVWPFAVSGILQTISLIWLAQLALRAVIFHNERRSLIMRYISPLFFLGSGLFGLWTWALAVEEKSWIARDEYSVPERHFMSKNEARVIEGHLEELADFLPE